MRRCIRFPESGDVQMWGGLPVMAVFGLALLSAYPLLR